MKQIGIALIAFVLFDQALEGIVEQVLGQDPSVASLVLIAIGAVLVLRSTDSDNL